MTPKLNKISWLIVVFIIFLVLFFLFYIPSKKVKNSSYSTRRDNASIIATFNMPYREMIKKSNVKFFKDPPYYLKGEGTLEYEDNFTFKFSDPLYGFILPDCYDFTASFDDLILGDIMIIFGEKPLPEKEVIKILMRKINVIKKSKWRESDVVNHLNTEHDYKKLFSKGEELTIVGTWEARNYMMVLRVYRFMTDEQGNIIDIPTNHDDFRASLEIYKKWK